MRQPEDYPNLYIVDHPVIQHKLSVMRNKDTSTGDFRQLLEDISFLMSYPVTERLVTKDVEVETPLTKAQLPMLVNSNVAIVPILRAGEAMTAGLKRLFKDASIGYIGVRRDHVTHLPEEYLVSLPHNKDQTFMLVDPMLATGNSAVYAVDILLREGVKPDNIIFMALVSAPEGVKAFHAKHPNIPVYTASLDSHLNEKAYIVPGLGDAGDRAFGTI